MYLLAPRAEGGNRTALREALGYDPWIFPSLVNPRMNAAYIIFGLSLYEAADCILFLFDERAKWRSDVYKGIILAFLLHLISTVQGMIGYSSSPEVAGDFFAGPTEFGWVSYCMICTMLARWAYFYATMKIVLAVLPTSKPMKIVGSLVTFLAVLASLWYCVDIVIYYYQCLQQYYIYNATNDLNALYARIPTEIAPYLEIMPTALVIESVTMLAFMLLTKIPFVWEIFRSLNVPFSEAIKTMSRIKSIQRITFSGLLSIIEACIALTAGATDLSLAMTMFAMMFQIHTLARLSFEGSAAIVKIHSVAVRGPYSRSSIQVARSSQQITKPASTS